LHYRMRMLVSEATGGGDSAISPDGKKFLTSLRRNGNWDIWMFDIQNSSWSQVTHNSSDEFEAQWSPDGHKIVYTSTKKGNKDIFLMDLDKGEVKQLTDDPEDDEYPVFSPDGAAVSFTGGRWKEGRQFFTVQADGLNRQPLSNLPVQAGACSFHPSGESMICHAYDSGTGNVYLYPRRGGPRLQITQGSFWDYKPTVSPNGQWLAFSRSNEGPSAIWVMPFPVGDAKPLTSGDGDDRWPTWSHSGNEILFHRLRDVGQSVLLYDPSSNQAREIVPASEHPGAASLDPTGTRAVYSTRTNTNERLKIVELRTGAHRNFDLDLEDGYEAAFPRWSPDGSRIAFALKTDGRWEVAVARAAGGPVRVLTRGILNARGIRSPLDWSPDGKQLTFHVSTAPFEANLYLADVQTGALRNLTHDSWYSEAPSFTPDGTAVTFMSTRGGNWTWGFFEMSITTGKVKLLLGPDYIEKNYPRYNAAGVLLWSQFEPDGHELLAVKSPAGEVSLIRQRVNWARWPSFAPDGKQILFTSVDHSVEYWMAENLLAQDSPLHLQSWGSPNTALESATVSQYGGPNRSAKRASPVQMHHR
jgi:TolB protein